MLITINEEAKIHLTCQNRVRGYYRACLIIIGLSLNKAVCVPLQNTLSLHLTRKECEGNVCRRLPTTPFTTLRTFAADQ